MLKILLFLVFLGFPDASFFFISGEKIFSKKNSSTQKYTPEARPERGFENFIEKKYSAQHPVLAIQFSNIAAAKGSIRLGIYDRESAFMDVAQAKLLKALPVTQTGTLDISTQELPSGTYAISAFHDVNNNGKLDKNLLGIPTEPYVFSNQARPKFRAPNWQEAKFELGASGRSMVLKLETW